MTGEDKEDGLKINVRESIEMNRYVYGGGDDAGSENDLIIQIHKGRLQGKAGLEVKISSTKVGNRNWTGV